MCAQTVHRLELLGLVSAVDWYMLMKLGVGMMIEKDHKIGKK
jgi:hypothetical protein